LDCQVETTPGIRKRQSNFLCDFKWIL